MRKEIAIVSLSALIVLTLSFVAFNFQKYGITGFAVGEESFSEYNMTSANISKEIALKAIEQSEEIIREMRDEDLPTLYMNDTLLEAKKTFDQAAYAEILRGEVESSENEKRDAQRSLALVNWKKITYGDVLVYTDSIKERQEQSLLLMDKISLSEKHLSNGANTFISEETASLLSSAKIAFYEDRFNDAQTLISQYETSFESEKEESSLLSGLKSGTKNIFQKYWAYILVLLVLFGFSVYTSYKKLERRQNLRKIKKMRIEQEALSGLMKRTQEERFKENSISQLTYNIRMKKYQERIQKIKQELPVLELSLERKG